MRIRLILMIMGTAILLSASVAAFLTGDEALRIVLSAAILSLLFFSLIYLQLKFYREGDNKHIHAHREPPPENISAAPRHLKSPHHRAIWRNLEQTRNLMRQKEKETIQAQLKKEKHAIGLPREEEILFMADPCRLYIRPAALLFLVLSFFAAGTPKILPSVFSFACLVLSLLGLLLLTAFRFSNRYYLTNFRILVRKKFPLKKEQWSALNYPGVSMITTKKKLGREELTLQSGQKILKIKGVSKQKLAAILGILHKMGAVHDCPHC